MHFTIKLANSAEEKEAIYSFRYRIYIEELGKAHIKADHERKLLFDEADENATLYYALTADNKLIGTVRGIDCTQKIPDDVIEFFGIENFKKHFGAEEMAIVDRLMVDPAYRNLRLGHELMAATFVEGIRIGTNIGFLTCDEGLLPMYLYYGWLNYTEPVMLGHGKKRYKLLCFLRDKAHFKKVNSPLYNYLADDKDDKGLYADRVKKLIGCTFDAPELSFKQKAIGAAIKYRTKLNDLF